MPRLNGDTLPNNRPMRKDVITIVGKLGFPTRALRCAHLAMCTGGGDGDTNEGDPFVLKHASHAVEVRTDFPRPLLSTVGYLHADDFVLILKELEQSLPG